VKIEGANIANPFYTWFEGLERAATGIYNATNSNYTQNLAFYKIAIVFAMMAFSFLSLFKRSVLA
jgi:hypothetical protein